LGRRERETTMVEGSRFLHQTVAYFTTKYAELTASIMDTFSNWFRYLLLGLYIV
jgi:hypothetical protein